MATEGPALPSKATWMTGILQNLALTLTNNSSEGKENYVARSAYTRKLKNCDMDETVYYAWVYFTHMYK